MMASEVREAIDHSRLFDRSIGAATNQRGYMKGEEPEEYQQSRRTFDPRDNQGKVQRRETDGTIEGRRPEGCLDPFEELKIRRRDDGIDSAHIIEKNWY